MYVYVYMLLNREKEAENSASHHPTHLGLLLSSRGEGVRLEDGGTGFRADIVIVGIRNTAWESGAAGRRRQPFSPLLHGTWLHAGPLRTDGLGSYSRQHPAST